METYKPRPRQMTLFLLLAAMLSLCAGTGQPRRPDREAEKPEAEDQESEAEEKDSLEELRAKALRKLALLSDEISSGAPETSSSGSMSERPPRPPDE